MVVCASTWNPNDLTTRDPDRAAVLVGTCCSVRPSMVLPEAPCRLPRAPCHGCCGYLFRLHSN